MGFIHVHDGSFNPFPDRNLNTMWRKVGGWTLRHSLLEPVFLPPAKPNLILLPPAKPNLPPCRWRLISCSSPCFGGGANPEKKKPAAALKTSRAEGTKVPRSKSAVAKYEKMNKVVSVDVWDSMSLADLGNFSITLCSVGDPDSDPHVFGPPGSSPDPSLFGNNACKIGF
jgi:hypothetical protein